MTKLRAFFASPFRDDYLWIRDAVARACREMQVDLRAVDEVVVPGSSIIDSIHREIATADIGIAVVTALNSNVMYELGQLLGGGKPTIILADAATLHSLPFDIRSFSIIRYDPDPNRRAELTSVVAGAIARVKESLKPEFLAKVALAPMWMRIHGAAVTPPVDEVSSFSVNWEKIKAEAESMLGKKSCKTVSVEVVDTDDFRGWRQTLDCPCGDMVIVVVDLNGSIKKAKTR